jgi:hypothetical protein
MEEILNSCEDWRRFHGSSDTEFYRKSNFNMQKPFQDRWQHPFWEDRMEEFTMILGFFRKRISIWRSG